MKSMPVDIARGGGVEVASGGGKTADERVPEKEDLR